MLAVFLAGAALTGDGARIQHRTSANLLVPIASAKPSKTMFPRPTIDPGYPVANSIVVGPKQTNKFWSNWVVSSTQNSQNMPIYSMPWALRWGGGASQLWISHGLDWSVTWGDTGRVRWYTTPFSHEFALAAIEPLGVFQAVKEGLFGAHFEVLGPQGSSYKVTYPIYSGMVYVSGRYEGGITPHIIGGNRIQKIANGIWKFENGRGQEFRVYVLTLDGGFADSRYDFNAAGVLNRKLEGWVRLGHVLKKEDRGILDAHASAVLVDMDVELPRVGQLKYKFTTTNSSAEFAHFAYPHHLPLLPNRRAGLEPSKAPTKGWMTAVVGNTWTLEVDVAEAQAFDWLPHGNIKTSLEATVKAEVLKSWESLKVPASWQAETQKDSYYWSGKGLQKVGTVCLMLEKMLGHDAAETQDCAEVLGLAFECYYKPRDQVASYCSSGPQGTYYDDVWGGIPSQAGYGEENCWDYDFGNGCYNDHHYHYGYFVVSAAILVKFRPGLKETGLVDWVNMLIRDTTNPSALDTYFPRFRAFDFFDWHSWSRGLVPSFDGKDQESTSEEVNLLYGMILWGRVLGNRNIQGLGETMVSLEIMSIKQYFLMMDGNPNHPAGFDKNHVTGIFFANKVDYATWFGINEAFIHGIQMLPLTPPLQKSRSVAFCSQEWDQILYKASFPEDDPDYKWMSVIRTGSLAIIRPGQAFELLLDTPQEMFDSGLTKGWALYWTAIQPGK